MGLTAFPFDAVLDVTPNTLLGNDTATAAPAKALTTTQVRALLGVYTTAQVDALLSGKSDAGHTHAYSSLTGIPATFPPSAHNQAWSTITGTPTTLAGYGITDAAASGHTHLQSDVTGLTSALAAKADLVGGLVPANQLPSFVDDVLEFANLAAFPGTGESGKIYVALDTSRTYRWGGSTYVELTDSTAVWGSISGVLANQTDLTSALSGKSDTDHTHAYSSLTGIPSSFAPTAHKATHATGQPDALSPSDIGAVPTARTLTINGTALDLSADRSWTVSGGVGGSTGSVANRVLRASGTGGSTLQNSGLAISDTLEMRIGDATNNGRLLLQDSTAYSTTGMIQVLLGAPYIGQDFSSFYVKGNGEVYSYKGYFCDTSQNGYTGHQFIFEGGWGSIRRAVSTPTGNGNAIYNTYGLYVACGAGHGFSVAAGTSTTFIDVFNTFTNSTNYEKAILRFATYSSARYVQLACESLGTGIANMNLVLSPKGNGALLAGPMPDGTTTGGNARGANAVDLRTASRLSAGHVASGQQSFLGPAGWVASGLGSVSFGGTASGQLSCSFGDTTTASGICSIAGGNNSQATSNNNLAWGYFALATGNTAVALNWGLASGNVSFGHGEQFTAYLPGMYSHGGGGFGFVNGTNQFGRLILQAVTTNNTATNMLISPNYASRAIIPAGKVWHWFARICGVKSDGSAIAEYMRRGVLKRVGNTTTLVTIQTIGTDYEDNAATDVAITADDVNEALNIAVTGITGETWRWQAIVEFGDFAYGT